MPNFIFVGVSVIMRSEGYGSRSVCLFVCLSVCLSVCLFVYDYSRTTGYEAAFERYQHLQCYKGMKKECGDFAETTAFETYGVKTSEKANNQPLIRRLDGIAKQVWYADDSAAGSSLERLRRWWDLLKEIGPLYGYFPNGDKTHILAKPEHTEAAKEIFKGTGITVSSEGKRYLGGAMGTTSFLQQYVERKVNGWVKEIEKLSNFARTQPHAAYAAYTHGLSSRWNYLLRVTDWEALSSSDLLQPLETAIQSHFIPALTGQTPPGTSVREMLALPARLGGLGLINPVAIAQEQHASSQLISAPLVERVLHQDHQLANCQSAQQDIKAKVRSDKRVKQKEDARNLQRQLPVSLQRSMELSQEKGASTWLTALPIDDHGFALHKSAFRDALSLSGTIGRSRIHPLTAVAATHSAWSMLCPAKRGDFLQ